VSAIHLALRARAESATGFPTAREHENVKFTQPAAGVAFSEEDFVPATRALVTNSPNGLVVSRGLYVLRLYAAANAGLLALSTLADAILAQFPPAWALTLTDSSVIRVRSEALPYRGQIVNDVAGYARCTVTIPWQHWSYVA
jgi:hypothetical protein